VERPRFARWASLLAAGTTLAGGAAFAGHCHGDYAAWVHGILVFGVIGGALVLLAVVLWRNERPGSVWLAVVLVAAVSFRLLAAQADGKELSDDAARYHWDGKVLAHGINPYLHAPDDPRLAQLPRHAIDERINHPWVRTCYPPLAELLFAAAYLLSPGRLAGLHALTLAAEMLTWGLLAGQLRRRKSSRAWLLVAAWSPLFIFEGSLPGHSDLLGLPFFTLFLLALLRRRAAAAGVFLALAALVKPVPLIFLPAALRELGRRGSLRLLAALVATVVLFYLPFREAGFGLFSSTLLMATDWSFNGSLGALLERALPMAQAHAVAIALCAAWVLAAARYGADLLSRMLLAFAAVVVCTPTLFPWYLVWVFPLLVLRPDPALLALGTLAVLAEEVVAGFHASGVWAPAPWAGVAQYAPFYALLGLGAWRGWGMFRRGTRANAAAANP
jgi:hypothetical protein